MHDAQRSQPPPRADGGLGGESGPRCLGRGKGKRKGYKSSQVKVCMCNAGSRHDKALARHTPYREPYLSMSSFHLLLRPPPPFLSALPFLRLRQRCCLRGSCRRRRSCRVSALRARRFLPGVLVVCVVMVKCGSRALLGGARPGSQDEQEMWAVRPRRLHRPRWSHTGSCVAVGHRDV